MLYIYNMYIYIYIYIYSLLALYIAFYFAKVKHTIFLSLTSTIKLIRKQTHINRAYSHERLSYSLL